MDTAIDEIAEGIYRLSTYVPAANLVFNQYLVLGQQPLLFHAGHRELFGSVSGALAAVLPPRRLRWLSFGHLEADESGAMNNWLAAAPNAEIVQGSTGVLVSLVDLADRPPRALSDNSVLDLGDKRVRWIDTPHVPHGWDAGLLYEETTGTLLVGDLFTAFGQWPASTDRDLLGPAMATEDASASTALTPHTAPTIRRLAELRPTTLGLMHGPAFTGDGHAALNALAEQYDQRLHAALNR